MLSKSISSVLVRAAMVASTVGLVSGVQGALIAYEGFDYEVPGTLNTKTGGSGFGANAWTAVGGQANPVLGAGSLTYTDGTSTLETVGNMVTPANTSRSTRNFGSTIAAANQTLWVSFRINHTGTAALPTNHAGFSLFSAANGGGSELFLGKAGNATNWGMDTSSAAAAQRTGAVTTTGGRDAFLVYKLEYGATSANVSMWVNPVLDELLLGVAHATSTETGFTNIVSMRVSTGGNASGFQFDEFRMGTTFADVAPVPEPAALGVTALAAAALGARRRRA